MQPANNRKRPRPDPNIDTVGNSTRDSESTLKQRIAHACDRCRSRRAKCDGAQPTCGTCAVAQIACTYGTRTKKRGLPTGYVRLLEQLLALVCEAVPGAEESILQLLRTSSVAVTEGGVVLVSNALQPRANEERLLHNLWADGKLREAIEMRVMKINDGDKDKVLKSRVVWAGVLPLPGDAINQWNFPRLPPAGPLQPEDSTTYSLPLDLPDDAWYQIGLYLDYSHCWLPVVAKHEMVRLLSKRQEGLQCTKSEMALLWSALAVASSVKANPSLTSLGTYRSAAFSLLDGASTSANEQDAAALLLLGLSMMESDCWSDAYLLIGRAARLVQYLHCKNHAHTLKLNRLQLGGFILDTMVSAHIGAPVCLFPRHVMSALTSFEADGPEEWDQGSWELSCKTRIQSPVRAMSIFAQLAKLMNILNDTLTPMGSRVVAAEALDSWLDNIPKHCSPRQRSGPLTPPLATLHMLYRSLEAHFFEPSGTPCSDDAQVSQSQTSSVNAEYVQTLGAHAFKCLSQFSRKIASSSMTTASHGGSEQPVTGTIYGCASTPRTTPDATINVSPPVNVEESSCSFSSTQPNDSTLQNNQTPQGVMQPHVLNDFDQDLMSFNAPSQSANDTEAMQAMLDQFFEQNNRNGPILSNFMEDLGFFDVGMTSPDKPYF